MLLVLITILEVNVCGETIWMYNQVFKINQAFFSNFKLPSAQFDVNPTHVSLQNKQYWRLSIATL